MQQKKFYENTLSKKRRRFKHEVQHGLNNAKIITNEQIYYKPK